LEKEHLDVLQCPLSQEALLLDQGHLVSNHLKYPILEHIPILLSNPIEHERLIEEFKKSMKGDWFSKQQLTVYDSGPYRHHLKKREKVVKEIIENELRSKNEAPLKIIDLGCGDGAASRWLMKYFRPQEYFFLTDYNFLRLCRTRELFKEKQNAFVFQSKIEECPIKAESIDVVFSNHVIEHLYNDFAIFNTAIRALKPDGTLILGCPNEGVFWWMLAYALQPSSIRDSDHLHFYNRQKIIKMAEQVGFSLQKSYVLGYGLPQWQLDAAFRNFKIFDDIFHLIGKTLFENSGSALYFVFKKNK
jgi:ubiquinone/menaquinone biosynthesis C-methylase UbiE/uncharacterized protein YbaR (Trm112 family)